MVISGEQAAVVVQENPCQVSLLPGGAADGPLLSQLGHLLAPGLHIPLCCMGV